MLLEAVEESSPCLTHVGGLAITAGDAVHHTRLLLLWNGVFHTGHAVVIILAVHSTWTGPTPWTSTWEFLLTSLALHPRP